MKNLALILLATTIFTASKTYCQTSDSKLTGTWTCYTDEGNLNITFENSSNLIFDGEKYTYSISGNIIVVNIDGLPTNHKYWFKDSDLYIYFPEGYTLIFNKNNNANLNETVNRTSGNKFLSGKLCYYGSSSGSSSSYSNSRAYFFKTDGSFVYYEEQMYSGNNGSAYSADEVGQKGTYKISGNTVYVTFGNGDTYPYEIFMTQNNGQITEIKSSDEYYASGLCE